MPDSPGASIIIPVHNGVAYTLICLAALAQAQLDGSEVIVVDNGSTDATPQRLAAWAEGAPSRRVVDMGANAGFARGCNAGAALADRPMLVFLNNDTFVFPDWLPRLLEPFADGAVKVTGSRLLFPSDRVQHAGVAFDDRGPHHVFAGLPAEHPAVMERRDWQAVTGAALAIRTDEFRRLGGFDERYVNSFEDIDLCLRVKADGGRVVYVPDSVAYHFESVTVGRLGEDDDANYRRFISSWRGKFEQDLEPALQAARDAGYNLDDRVPPRGEALRVLRDTEAKLAEVESENLGLAAELAEARFWLDLKSVRLALKGQRLLRSLHVLKRRDASAGRSA
jgi:GT2 family glycosyltransferase